MEMLLPFFAFFAPLRENNWRAKAQRTERRTNGRGVFAKAGSATGLPAPGADWLMCVRFPGGTCYSLKCGLTFQTALKTRAC
jgi:hypothetical protein